VLVDNRSSDLAGYEDELLAELLREVSDLEGTGWDAAALDGLLAEIGQPALDEEGEAPPPAPEPRTQPGDLYVLGRHRLLCADARDADSYARLLEGERAELVWSDPPYGVDYEGKTAERLKLAGDGADGIAELLAESFTQIDRVLSPGAPVYLAHPAGPLSVTFAKAFAERWRLRQTLVWVTRTP
jgi:hypothetical protein